MGVCMGASTGQCVLIILICTSHKAASVQPTFIGDFFICVMCTKYDARDAFRAPHVIIVIKA